MNDKTAGVTGSGFGFGFGFGDGDGDGDGECAPARIARGSQLASQLYFQGNLAT